jgi:hypothetical protein
MYDEVRSSGADILSVAVDLQGAEKARPFHDAAGARFTTVVDETNSLAELFGFKAVPNGMLIDEEGRLAYKRFSGFDIRKPEEAEAVRMFLADGDPAGGVLARDPAGGATRESASRDGVRVESMEHFRRGLALLRAGDRDRAVSVWREGIAAEPDNWLMRKQLWALEHPEKFYAGPVDFAWQKTQIDAGR